MDDRGRTEGYGVCVVRKQMKSGKKKATEDENEDSPVPRRHNDIICVCSDAV